MQGDCAVGQERGEEAHRGVRTAVTVGDLHPKAISELALEMEGGAEAAQ